MAHIKLSHNRAFLLRAYPLQTPDLSHRARTNGATMALIVDAHVHAFRVVGGVPGCGMTVMPGRHGSVPTRTRTTIDRVSRGKERQVNAQFLTMASHYVFEPAF